MEVLTLSVLLSTKHLWPQNPQKTISIAGQPI